MLDAEQSLTSTSLAALSFYSPGNSFAKTPLALASTIWSPPTDSLLLHMNFTSMMATSAGRPLYRVSVICRTCTAAFATVAVGETAARSSVEHKFSTQQSICCDVETNGFLQMDK